MPVDGLASGDAACADNIVRFLERVLPKQGYFATASLSTAGGDMRQEFHATVSAAVRAVDRIRFDGRNVFFSPAVFSAEQRTADKADVVRSFWVDIDCGPGKPHENQAAAVMALDLFRRTVGLWAPLIVNSGGGIHAYWPLDADVTPDDWRRVAACLKRAAAALGLHADPSRTADIASLMRAPGSFNLKDGGRRPVTVLRWGKVGSFAAFEAAVAADVAPNADVAPTLSIGPLPAYIAALPPGSFESLTRTDVDKLRSAAMAVPAAVWRDRDTWLRVLLFALASEAISDTSSAGALRDVLHAVSSQPEACAGSKGHESGYSRAWNDREWESALARSRSRWVAGEALSGAGSLFRLAIEHGWSDARLHLDANADGPPNHNAAANTQAGVVAARPLALSAIDPTTWQDKDVPRREWLIDGWVSRGSAAILSGTGGVGKSLVGQQVSTCLSIGVPFIGLPARSVGALYITSEDSEDELHRRQAAINQALGCGMADLGRLRLVSLLGEYDNELVLFGKDGTARRGPLFDKIKSLALDADVAFVCLDHAAHFFGGNENDRHQVTVFTNMLNELSLRINGSVMLLGHESKAGATYSGSTAWQGGVRQHWHLGRPGSDGGSVNPDERVLSLAKANYAQRGSDLSFVWDRGAFVHRSPVSDFADGRCDDAVFLKCLAVATGQQRAVSHSRNAGNYAPKVFALMSEADRLKPQTLTSAMERLFSRGEIAADQRLWQRPNRDWVSGIAAINSAQGCVCPPVHDGHA